jgi:hypothetical protein
MENIVIIALIVIVVILCWLKCKNVNKTESFAKSGLSISDRDCNKMMHIYGPEGDMSKQFCEKHRRETIDFPSSNYLTRNGVLV